MVIGRLGGQRDQLARHAAAQAGRWTTIVRADHDAIPAWQAHETSRRRSPILFGLWWVMSTIGIGLGVVAAIVLVVSGLL